MEQAFSIRWLSRWGRVYIFCNQRGFAGVVEDLGQPWMGAVASCRGPDADRKSVGHLAKESREFVLA